MPRKAALITEAAVHFAVDLACFFFLAGPFSSPDRTGTEEGAGWFLFLILSFGLRPLLGTVMDEFPRFHSQSLGCLLIGLAVLLPSSWGWVSLFSAAVGSALFHTGAVGESLAFARGYFSRIAFVLSPGAFGAAVGVWLGSVSSLSGWVLFLILFVGGALCFFFSEARKYPRRIRSFQNSVKRGLPSWGILALTLFPALMACLVIAILPSPWTDGGWTLIPALACALGRAAGGVLSDRFGPRKTVAVCFAVALTGMTLFTHIPWLHCLGLAALCAPVSVTVGTAAEALSTRPHLAFGVCSTVILVGTLPGFFRGSATVPVRILCALLLALALGVSLFLYTDHSRIFELPKKKKKEERGSL